MRALTLDWRIQGPDGAAFLVLIGAIGAAYLAVAAHGNRRDRRGRRWPASRSVCFIGGLAALVVDLYSGIGGEADARLSAHMLEHMVMWVLVAPLLVAGAPVRLAFYSLPRSGRRALARLLRSGIVSKLTGPVGSVSLFTAVLLVTHLPALYGLALSNVYVHEGEHGLYLLTSVLMWAPVLGVDPLPHRPGPRGRIACMIACMLPMTLIAAWLASTPGAVYGHYLHALGPAALADQRLAATIMLAAGLPAMLAPKLASFQISPSGVRRLLRSSPSSGIAADSGPNASRAHQIAAARRG